MSTQGMPSGSATTRSVDYLQRTGERPAVETQVRTEATAGSRRLLRVRGVGRPDRDRRRLRTASPDQRWQPLTSELLTGLYGYRIPVAYSIVGSPAGIDVRLGTWSPRPPDSGAQDRRREVIGSLLRGLYAKVDLEPVEVEAWEWPLGGLALGIPSGRGVDDADQSAPIDRVVRSLVGTDWEILVLAHPLAEPAVARVREQLLNEMRTTEEATKAEGAPSPLAEHYMQLLAGALESAGESLGAGAWRTAAYLLGDGASYPRLAAAWRSAFSGLRSLPEPVRVFDLPEVDELAQAWALPDQAAEPGPGSFTRPFELQSLLTTSQLAEYVHLPELETPGFSVQLTPRFDTVPATAPTAGDISVGTVLQGGEPSGVSYGIDLTSLTRHAFVGGLTGSGKTNTIFSLLREADRTGIPFLVIEPAKTEYRALIDHPDLGKRVRVFTAGRLSVSPLLLNPFEVPEGTSVSEHLDLLRAAFSAAFGMWTPLPQILERCLHAVYVDRGWDLRTNANRRLAEGDDPTDAFPTVSDLVAKVTDVVPTLGYDDRVAHDMQAALVTRLDALRTGGKGAMLDVARSISIAELLSAPTVIELEALADEGDKAFLTALLVIRLAEHRRSAGQVDGLRHLLVIEEAHRLLSNVGRASEGEADPRGQAVETFSNLLSEIRAYGQGVIIADQVPVRLAPDVLKNTNLKIAHRTVSYDDRQALAGAMAMDDEQSQALTTLAVGEAAVFSSGDDTPLLVRIPLAKDPLSPTPPRDPVVAKHMAAWRKKAGIEHLFLHRPSCAETCAGAPEACDAARVAVGLEVVQRAVSRLATSLVEDSTALERQWDDLLSVVRPRRPIGVADPAYLRAIAGHAADWYAGRRGAQHGWAYGATATLAADLRGVLLDRLAPKPAKAQTAKLRSAFQGTARRLFGREEAPYPACEQVCTNGLCLYRSAVADLVLSGRYRPAWQDADARDGRSEDGNRRATWSVCQDAGYELVQFPEPDLPAKTNATITAAARRACVCFEQQMLADDPVKVPRTSRRVLARVLAEAGL